MISTLIVVPARGGSVGIPRKALRPLAGKPPLQWTLETLQPWRSSVVVVTDDVAIHAVASGLGYVVERDPPTEGDAPRTWQHAVAHVAAAHPSHRVAVVQCTSPFLRPETVDRALLLLESHPAVVTVTDDRASRIGGPRIARQVMQPCWKVTGGFTGVWADRLVASRLDLGMWADERQPWHLDDAELVELSGAEALDLDTQEDWWIAERYAGESDARDQLLVQLEDEINGAAYPVAVFSAWDEDPTEWLRRRATWEDYVLRRPIYFVHGDHTRDEAERILKNFPDAAEIGLSTSAYHQPRAFLTVLKVAQEMGREVALWNHPVPSTLSKWPIEQAKIAEYQAKGHVASYADGVRHLRERAPCGT